MGPLGFPELLIFLVLLTPVLGVFGLVLYWLLSGQRARRFGYTSTKAYLRAIPRSDAEKRDAADLAMRGVVLCMLGLVFSPFVLAGLIPLFYGGRKLVYSSMGLGLVDDADRPSA